MRKVILLFGILFSVVPRAESDPVTLSGTGVFDFVSTVPGEELQPLLGFNVAQGEAFTFSFDFSSPPTLDFIGEGFAF